MANPRFPNFSKSKLAAGSAILVILAGCSSPKPAAVSAPPAKPAAADRAAALPGAPQADQYVATVRSSTMSGYPASTIGAAFEAAFGDSQWRSRTSNGVQVVDFTGTLPAHVRRECLSSKETRAARTCGPDARVTFQWTFTADGRLFHLSYIDPEPWPESHRSTREMLLFIYG